MMLFLPSIRNFDISIEECEIYLKNMTVYNYTIITRISSSSFACFFYIAKVPTMFSMYSMYVPIAKQLGRRMWVARVKDEGFVVRCRLAS